MKDLIFRAVNTQNVKLYFIDNIFYVQRNEFLFYVERTTRLRPFH